ncbi:MAG: hypothetical protein GY836_13005, partial [Herbaspirillum sp.]|uniref:hypothetical protein n=1 Tax=Herbaspirillum sp. TaxID=1890675 RepID=UPI00258CD2ED
THAYNRFGQLVSEDFLAPREQKYSYSRRYEYHPEAAATGTELKTTREKDRLDKETGGFLKRAGTSMDNGRFSAWGDFLHDAFSYDQRGNVETVQGSDGSTAKYEYNNHDQLRKESMVSASKPNHKPYRYEGAYTYYPDGALDTKSSSYGTGKKLDGGTVKYTYTPRNMVETITDVSKGHVVQYTYDLN